MFATELIMSLMGTTLSINQLSVFYDHFFDDGWDYFNRVVLKMFELTREKLLKIDNLPDAVIFLKKVTQPYT